jgi:hypothetical protein
MGSGGNSAVVSPWLVPFFWFLSCGGKKWWDVGQVGLAQVVSPPNGTEAVGPLLVGSKVSSLLGSPDLVGRVKFLPKLSGAGEGVGGQKSGGGQDNQDLVGDGQTALAVLRCASSSTKMYSGMSSIPL